MPNPKVIIACPMSPNSYPESLQSIMDISYTPLSFYFDRNGSHVPYVHGKVLQKRLAAITKARNDVLSSIMKLEWDYVLWIDADTVVPKTIVDDLLLYNEKIVTAKYLRRNAKYKNEGGKWAYHQTAEWTGFGCILIKREVHEKVGTFNYDSSPFGATNGEDVNYSNRMRKNGYQIRIADVTVRHLPAEREE